MTYWMVASSPGRGSPSQNERSPEGGGVVRCNVLGDGFPCEVANVGGGGPAGASISATRHESTSHGNGNPPRGKNQGQGGGPIVQVLLNAQTGPALNGRAPQPPVICADGGADGTEDGPGGGGGLLQQRRGVRHPGQPGVLLRQEGHVGPRGPAGTP